MLAILEGEASHRDRGDRASVWCRGFGSCSHRKELAQFGAWFASGRFGGEWSLAMLRETLQLAGVAEPDGMVMDQLVKWAPQWPANVVECARLMVEGADQPWKMEAWQSEIRQIVHAALEGGGDDREAVTRLINVLGARGYLQYRDLLGGGGD